MKIPKNLGMLLVAVYLISVGLIGGVFGLKLDFSYGHDLVSLLAIVAGILLLLGR